jgi:type IV pilus assembly protein PilW
MSHPMQRQRRQSGMSIIEMMIGIALSSMVMLGMITLFAQSRNSYRQDELVARLQEDARFAMTNLQRDIAMAGFWADLLDPSVIQNEGSIAGGGDLFEYTTPMVVADNIDGTEEFLGEGIEDAVEGTDAFSIVKLHGGRVDIDTTADIDDVVGDDPAIDDDTEINTFAESEVIDPDAFYLRTNGVIGRMSQGSELPTGANAVPTPFSYWKYSPVIYWVRNYAVTAGDGIPTLCRKSLSAGALTTECLAQGIEDMQVEYGIDTNDDDYADRYKAAPTAAEMPLVTSVRIYLLGRATAQDQNYTNTKTYAYSNSPNAPDNPGDGYYRRVFTTTIAIRNNANNMKLQST